MKGANMKTHATNLVGKILVSLLLCGIAAFWSLQVFGAEWSEAQKEIWNLEKKYWECIKNADVETYKNLLHDNVIVMRTRDYTPNNKSEEIESIRRWVGGYDVVESYEIMPLAIQLINNVAMICFNYEYTGNMRSDSGRVTHTWMKQNGTWYLIGMMEASFKSNPWH
jgi:hypothetical protein